MKRTFSSAISLLICISFLLSSAFTLTLSAADTNEAPEMGSIEEILASYYDPDGRPMSCAHRAITYIGSPLPENSLAAIQECIDRKVDIAELDIMRTKDGVYVLCHDDSITRTTTYDGSLTVSEMTYEEICKYPLIEYTGGTRDVYLDKDGNTQVIPTFEDALKLCKGKIMINLDKFKGLWDYRMELYELVKKNDCLDIVMFKAGYKSDKILGWHGEIKAEYGEDAVMPNFCTLNSNRDGEAWISEIKAHSDAKTAFAVEAGFSDYTQPQSNPEYTKEVRQYARLFANVLYDALGGTYSAQNREDSTGWSEVISLGYNILQTNNAADLAAYIYANYSSPARDIGAGLDLLYFSDFKHQQTSYSIKINAPSVRLYSGDYISFKNVDFGTSDGKNIILSITESSGEGKLVIRRDSPTGEVIAEFDLSKLGNPPLNAAGELKSDNLGVCDIYLCAENTGEGYVSVSKLTRADQSIGEIIHIVGLSVFTRPGVAPELPDEVTVTDEFGFAYKAEVIWSQVPKECYSDPLTRFTVPGIIKSNCRTVYASVTVIDLDMSDAAVWFDSNGDMLTDEDGRVLQWYDSINLVTASTADEAPLYKDGAVSFDGVDDSMSFSHSLSNKGNISIILNARTEKSSTDYMSDYKINNSARYTLLFYPEAKSWGSVYLTAFENGIACRFGSGKSGNRGIYFTGKTVEGWSTVSAVKGGVSEKIYLGSSMVYDRGASSFHQAGDPGEKVKATEEFAYIGLGIQGSVKHYYNGEVRDIVIFERTLGDEEIAVLDAYFKAKNENTLKDKSDILTSELDSAEKNNIEKGHLLEYTSADASSHTESCTLCSYSASESHVCNYSEKDEVSHSVVCALCSYSGEAEHDYLPSENSEGQKIYKCSACGAEKSITGQSGTIVLIAVAVVAAPAVIAAVIIILKKKKTGSK
ncbi:MAG: carbohydrate-binding protein [Clostridia bacterium]|nr:carbohydrate-binding protein [Clostridia bacterium]